MAAHAEQETGTTGTTAGAAAPPKLIPAAVANRGKALSSAATTDRALGAQDVISAAPAALKLPDDTVAKKDAATDKALASGPPGDPKAVLGTSTSQQQQTEQDQKPLIKEFKDLVVPDFPDLLQPEKSNGSLDENPRVDQFVRDLLRIATGKRLLREMMDEDGKKNRPGHVKFTIRHSGAANTAMMSQQYRQIMGSVGSGDMKNRLRVFNQNISHVRHGWLMGLWHYFLYLEYAKGKDDPLFDRGYGYQSKKFGQPAADGANLSEEEKRVDLLPQQYFSKSNSNCYSARGCVKTLLDDTWKLAMGDAAKEKVKFYVTNRHSLFGGNRTAARAAQSFGPADKNTSDEHDSGYAVDVFLEEAPEEHTGFWKPGRVGLLIGHMKAVAKQRNYWLNIYYNDSILAIAANKVGNQDILTVKPKLLQSTIWHGPRPLVLHFHLDVVPIAKM